MAGRPTKYNKQVQQQADDYVAGGYVQRGDVVPSVAGLACALNVDRNTIHDWRDQHDAFFRTLKRLEAEQERLAVSGGLAGDYNSTICKLLLANHGYSERHAVDQKSSDGSMSPKRIEITGPGGKRGDDDS